MVQDVQRSWKWAASICGDDIEKKPKRSPRHVNLITPLRKALKDSSVKIGGVGTATDLLSGLDHFSSQVTTLSLSSRSAAFPQVSQAVSLTTVLPNSQTSPTDCPAIIHPSPVDLEDYLAEPPISLDDAVSIPTASLLSQEELDRDLQDIEDFLQRISASEPGEIAWISEAAEGGIMEDISK